MNLLKSHPKNVMAMLLQHGRAIAVIPDSVRARTLSRARSTMATAAPAAEQVVAAPIARHRGLAIALAAAVACAVGAAGAAVALRSRAHHDPRTPPVSNSQAEAASCVAPTALSPASQVAPQPSPAPKPQRAERLVTAQESYTAELGLLQGAQAAYADRNFATALLLVTEHTRRFPNGRLAEEREALHVKALIGTGREEEARRAASAFRDRFPRSALLRRHEPSGRN
jgi:hypothetical protein